ncbi:DUF4262 domain-containing protein [Alteromonas sp. K632G]|uniref:DUF4262 domain-containing protein n=1 Tax=Alteromonas sp. K632G TaxID=2820757 RepID=UPI001AD60539|nr:DUF4262 domain-containing protein [Alteromonas sp. K632G]
MDEQDKKALDNIDKYGCHVLNIMEGDGEPCFTYSIGIEKSQGKPDLVIQGLKRELAHNIVNDYKDRLLSGETFEPGKYYSDFIGGLDVCFIEVAKSHYKEYFGWGLWLNNGDNFRMLQLVWPTTEGVWPWHEGKSEYYQWAQPLLNSSGELSEI